MLVCSAACGADQVALEAAGGLGLTRASSLPFDESRFRVTSVVDRGVVGAPFDRTMAELRAANAVITLPGGADDTASYALANLTILDDAQALARVVKAAVVAVLVAEGEAAYESVENSFAEEAKKRGLPTVSISTLG